MQIAILLYDKFTALDAIVPYEVSPWAVLLRMWKLTGRPGRPGQGLPPAPGRGAFCSGLARISRWRRHGVWAAGAFAGAVG